MEINTSHQTCRARLRMEGLTGLCETLRNDRDMLEQVLGGEHRMDLLAALGSCHGDAAAPPSDRSKTF